MYTRDNGDIKEIPGISRIYLDYRGATMQG